MSATAGIESVRFVVDSKGNRSAVLVDLDVWEQILTMLEDLEDIEELRRARQEDEETVVWEQVKADLDLED